MADEAIKTLAVKIALEDGSFQDGMQSIKRTMQVADSNFKASVAGIKDWGNNLDALKGNSQRLSSNIDSAKNAVKSYQDQLEKSKSALEQNSQKMADNKSKLDATRKAYDESVSSIGKNTDATKKLKAELDAAQKAYDNSEKVVRNNNKSVEGYTIQLNNEKAKLNELNSALKENDTQIQKVEKSQSLLGKATEKVGLNAKNFKTAIGAVGLAAGSFLKNTLTDTNDAEKANANLEQTLKSTGGAAGMTSQQLNELAESLQGSTTYEADNVKQGEAMLLTFTNIGKNVFPQATQAMLDWSTKMKTDPASAAVTLGKALNDPANGLSKLTKAGVTFSAAQQKQIKAMQATGDVAGAQKIMLQELSKEFGGQASAAASTYEGHQKQIANQLKDVKESIGSALVPVLAQLGGFLVQILKPVAQFITQNPQLSAGILAVTAIVGTLVGGLSVLGTALTAINVTIDMGLLPTIGIVVAAIAGVALAAALIVKNWGPISTFFTNLWKQILNVTKPVWQEIQKVITDAWNIIGPTIKSGLQAVQSFWNSVWPQIKQVFSDAWNAMKVILAPILAILYINIKTNMALIQSVWKTSWTLIKDTFKLVWDLVVGIVKTAWTLISGAIKTGLDLITGLFKIFKDLFTGNWSALWNDVKSLFSNIWNDISGIFKGVVGNIGDIFKNLAHDAIQWGGDLINGFVDGIKSAIGGLANAVKDVAKKVKSYLHFSTPDEGPLADYETWMPDFMSGLAEGITANKYKVAQAIQGLSSEMSIGVKAQYQPAYAGGYSPSRSEATEVPINFYQYNTSPKPLSPAETARQTRNIIRQANLKIRK